MTFDRDGVRGRVSDHLDYDRLIDDAADVGRYVDVRNYPGQVHRTDVDAVNDHRELRTVPAGRVHEVAIWHDDDRERVLGAFDGPERASGVAVDLATREDLPLLDAIHRLLPDETSREKRRREGRWPPHRDEARDFEADLPDDVTISPNDHDVCVRIVLDPDPDPPRGDDVPLDAFEDGYDVLLAHNVSPYEVIDHVEESIESRQRAIDAAVATARDREWAVHPRMTLSSSRF